MKFFQVCINKPKVDGWNVLLSLSLAETDPGTIKPNLCVDRYFRFSSRNINYKEGKDMITCHVDCAGLIPDKGHRE